MNSNHTTAIEIYRPSISNSNLLLTCEHASNAMPLDWCWPDQDQWLSHSHWAWDPGAAALTRALADELACVAVLSRFSRLLIDPNRPLVSATLFRNRADGRNVVLNQDVDEFQTARRIEHLYQPYHHAIDTTLSELGAQFLLAIHSFTPEYQGRVRDLEVGVMHVNHPNLAQRWCALFERAGWHARIDEPYAGSGGFMFCPNLHAQNHGIPAIMLEFRQDLVNQRRDEIVTLLKGSISALTQV